MVKVEPVRWRRVNFATCDPIPHFIHKVIHIFCGWNRVFCMHAGNCAFDE